MNRLKLFDVVLTAVSPLLLGCLIYGLVSTVTISPFIRNYLPDACWAFSLFNSILIIWRRRLHIGWLACCFGLGLAFEWGQHAGLLAGSGDIFDLAVYALSGSLAIWLNSPFRRIFYSSIYHQNLPI